MLSFLVAIVFIVLTAPAWAVIGTIRGIFTFVIEFFDKGWWLIENTFFIEYTLPAGDVIVTIFAVPINAVWQGFVAFFQTLGAFWDWSRYDHPWWAFFICIAICFFYLLYSSNRSRS